MFQAQLNILHPKAREQCLQGLAKMEPEKKEKMLERENASLTRIAEILSLTSQEFCSEYRKFIASLNLELTQDERKHTDPESLQDIKFVSEGGQANPIIDKVKTDITSRILGNVRNLIHQAIIKGKRLEVKNFLLKFPRSPLLSDPDVLVDLETFNDRNQQRHYGPLWSYPVTAELVAIQRAYMSTMTICSDTVRTILDRPGDAGETSEAKEEKETLDAATNTIGYFTYCFTFDNKFYERFMTKEVCARLEKEYFDATTRVAIRKAHAKFIYANYLSEDQRDELRDEFLRWKSAKKAVPPGDRKDCDASEGQ